MLFIIQYSGSGISKPLILIEIDSWICWFMCIRILNFPLPHPTKKMTWHIHHAWFKFDNWFSHHSWLVESFAITATSQKRINNQHLQLCIMQMNMISDIIISRQCAQSIDYRQTFCLPRFWKLCVDSIGYKFFSFQVQHTNYGKPRNQSCM